MTPDIERASSVPPCENTEIPVWCIACNDWRFPDSKWRCTGGCGEICYYGFGPGHCRICGAKCKGLRFGHQWKPLCDCQVSPQQKARWQAGIDRQTAREKAESQKRKATKRIGHPGATACWDDHEHNCAVTYAAPKFDFCRQCPKFGAPRASPRRFGLQDPEMQEIEL